MRGKPLARAAEVRATVTGGARVPATETRCTRSKAFCPIAVALAAAVAPCPIAVALAWLACAFCPIAVALISPVPVVPAWAARGSNSIRTAAAIGVSSATSL